MPQSPSTADASIGSVQQRVGAAERLMEQFAARTGIGGRGDPGRGTVHLDRALALVELVHRSLGSHRPDDRRSGWISCLDEESGRRHPTIGGLLSSAAVLVRLTSSGLLAFDPLRHRLLADAQRGLASFVSGHARSVPTGSRLAFRELGLAIGLQSVPDMQRALQSRPSRFGGPRDAASLLARLEALASNRWLAGLIELAWGAPEAQAQRSWQEHLDINAVMLAASLLPAE